MHLSNGFSKAGIYPYDPRAVSKEKILQRTHSSSNASLSSSHVNQVDSNIVNEQNSLPSNSSEFCPSLSLYLSRFCSLDHISMINAIAPHELQFDSSLDSASTAI